MALINTSFLHILCSEKDLSRLQFAIISLKSDEYVIKNYFVNVATLLLLYKQKGLSRLMITASDVQI